MNIGENIKAVREHHNMSQNDFAKLLNMTASAVSAWELGTREPRVKNLRQIAELFQIPMSVLTEGDAETCYETAKAPAPAETEAQKPPKEELIAALMLLHVIRNPAETLSDADMQFLTNIVALLNDWFGRPETPVKSPQLGDAFSDAVHTPQKR